MSAYCGTKQGWETHRANNEPPCKWCVKAVTTPAPVVPEVKTPKPPKPYVSRAKPGAHPGGKPPAKCGTASGYRKDLRLGEPIDTPCRDAANEYRRQYKKQRGARK